MTRKTPRQLEREIAEHRERAQLLTRVRKLLDKWEPILGVKIRDLRAKKMKTYWASINKRNRRMTVALSLAAQSPSFQEYTIVHELVHLLTKGHDAKFLELMDQHLPNWRKHPRWRMHVAPET